MEALKLVVVGGGGVGKSAMTIQFVQYHFIGTYDPTMEDTYRKQLAIDDEICLVDILDTAGQEDDIAMWDSKMRAHQAFVLAYSITCRSSFDEILTFKEQICRVKDANEVPMVLVGNKSDAEESRQVAADEGEALAKAWNIPFFEASARLRINIDELFSKLVRAIRRRDRPASLPNNSGSSMSKCSIM